MANSPKIIVRKTPCGLHLYTARIARNPVYGWGNTPAEARSKLAERLARATAAKARAA